MMFLTFLTRSPRFISFTPVVFTNNKFNQLMAHSFLNQSKQIHTLVNHKNPRNLLKHQVYFISVDLARYKSSKRRKLKRNSDDDDENDEDESSLRTVEEDDDDDDDDEYLSKGKGIELKSYNVSTLRIDSLLKTCFNLSRRSVEESFYDQKIWINGKLLLKKGLTAKPGDEIDVFIGFVDNHGNLMTVKRLEILKVNLDDDNHERIIVKVRKTKSMMIENRLSGHENQVEKNIE